MRAIPTGWLIDSWASRYASCCRLHLAAAALEGVPARTRGPPTGRRRAPPSTRSFRARPPMPTSSRPELDPAKVPNIAILNYSDVLRRFMLNQSVTMSDLDSGVQQCVRPRPCAAGSRSTRAWCRSIATAASGWTSSASGRRPTPVASASTAFVLLKDGVVITSSPAASR